MHALRLGLHGIELLTTGRVTLPIPEPHRAYLRSIRRGRRPLAEVLDAVADAETQLTELRDSPARSDQPDRRLPRVEPPFRVAVSANGSTAGHANLRILCVHQPVVRPAGSSWCPG